MKSGNGLINGGWTMVGTLVLLIVSMAGCTNPSGSDVENGSDGGNGGGGEKVVVPTKAVRLPWQTSVNTTQAERGAAVAVEGEVVVVGLPGNVVAARDLGSVEVFTKVNGTWERSELIVPSISDADAGAEFGGSVAIVDRSIIVGVPLAGPTFIGDRENRGSVMTYVRDGSGAYSLKQLIRRSDLNSAGFGAQFGASLATDGDTLVVGSPGANVDGETNNLASGAAFVYVPTGSGWQLQDVLAVTGDTFGNSRDGANLNEFGRSVAIDGNVAVIGAPKNDIEVSTDERGAAYVFTREGTVWTPRARLIRPGALEEGGQNNFGRSVAIEGNTIMVASFDHESNSEEVHVFTGNDATWTHQQVLTSGVPDSGSSDDFGASIALSYDVAVVGAPGRAVGQRTGAVSVFQKEGSAWELKRTFAPEATPPLDTGDGFGAAVAYDGTTAVAGAPSYDAETGTTGANGGAWVLE